MFVGFPETSRAHIPPERAKHRPNVGLETRGFKPREKERWLRCGIEAVHTNCGKARTQFRWSGNVGIDRDKHIEKHYQR